MLRGGLSLIAVLAVLGASACDGDEGGDRAGGADGEGQQTASDPAAAGDALADISRKPVIPKPTGTPPRRLVKEDIVRGRGPAAKEGDTVLVRYVGMNFSNGREYDSSWDGRAPLRVRLGAGTVIPGWERGLEGIREGGRRKLTIPPRLAYGPEGYPPNIPPNETLVLVVDALGIR